MKFKKIIWNNINKNSSKSKSHNPCWHIHWFSIWQVQYKFQCKVSLAATLYTVVLWIVTPFSPVGECCCFGGMQCLWKVDSYWQDCTVSQFGRSQSQKDFQCLHLVSTLLRIIQLLCWSVMSYRPYIVYSCMHSCLFDSWVQGVGKIWFIIKFSSSCVTGPTVAEALTLTN